MEMRGVSDIGQVNWIGGVTTGCHKGKDWAFLISGGTSAAGGSAILLTEGAGKVSREVALCRQMFVHAVKAPVRAVTLQEGVRGHLWALKLMVFGRVRPATDATDDHGLRARAPLGHMPECLAPGALLH
jgi:hypothetical protein